jgi:hypothetical protein
MLGNRGKAEEAAPEAEPQPGEEEPAAESQPKPQEAAPAEQPQPGAKDATPASDDEGPKNWGEARKALKEATSRAKALERQVAELSQKVMAPDKTEQTRPEIPDPIVDPAGYARHMDDARFRERVELTRELLIDAVGQEKFEAAEAAFLEAAQADRDLQRQLRHAANPARFAYSHGAKLLETRKDPNEEMFAAFKARLEADFDLVPKAKPNGQAGAHATAQQPVQQRSAQPVTHPTSLADARSAGSNAAPQWAGPKPLSQLIGQRRKP